MIRGKKAGAELILEVLLATIIFFIFVAIIFTFLSPQLKLKAIAHIQSVDPTLACDTSLTNFMRFEKDGITYADLLANLYVENLHKDKSDLDFSKFYDDALSRFEAVYGSDKVNISISDQTGLLYGSDKINLTTAESVGIFNCSFYVPMPASRVQKDCFYFESKNSERISQNKWKDVTFEIPEIGEVKVAIVNSEVTSEEPEPSGFGVDGAYSDSLNVIDYESKNLLEEGALKITTDDTQGIDAIVIPLRIPAKTGQYYELFVAETKSDFISSTLGFPQADVIVQLRKRGEIQDCSIKVLLTTPGFKRYGTYEEWEEAQKEIKK